MTAPQVTDFKPKKWPRQARSRATFDALVEACAQVLASRGYAATTTNHVARRAGVGIASLYEYFPHKDALVAQVAERLVQRVMARLDDAMQASLAMTPDRAVHHWLWQIHDILCADRELVAVFHYQVPWIWQLPVVRNLNSALMTFSEMAARQAGNRVALPHNRADLHLLINLVAGTLMRQVLEPAADTPHVKIMEALEKRVSDWVRPSHR